MPAIDGRSDDPCTPGRVRPARPRGARGRFHAMKACGTRTMALLVLAACGWTPPSWAQEPPHRADSAEVAATVVAERAATGGRAWEGTAAVVIEGTLTEGGAPGAFRKVVDLRTGHSRTRQAMGSATQMSGFDGMPWVAANGIVNEIDLPALVEDARSRAFVDRAGWRDPSLAAESATRIEHGDARAVTIAFRPEGGSEVRVTFDAGTRLVSRIVAETDFGPVVTTWGDWRSVGPVTYAFRQEQTDATGARILVQVDRVTLLERAEAGALARPEAAPRGRLAAGASSTVPFTFVGGRQSHILVAARVSGVDANLIFDTGAANYVSPEAARRFGLAVSGGVNIGGAGESSATGGFATAARIVVGSAELSDQAVIVGPLPFPSSGPRPVDGFTGFELLYAFRTTIDYPARTLTFAPLTGPPPAEGTRLPFFSDGHSIYVEAAVDGRRGLFRLDTGDGGTVTLFPAFAARHGLYPGAGPAAVSAGGVGGQVSSRAVTLSRFSLAGVPFDALPAHLSLNRAGAFSSRSLAGNLGGGVLRCFRITIDYPARVLTLEPRLGTDVCPGR
jgi:predicted aspartyl protease